MHIPIYFYFLKKKLNISTVKVRNATMYFNLIWWKNLTDGKEGNILLLMTGRLEVLNMLIHHWIQITPFHRVTAASAIEYRQRKPYMGSRPVIFEPSLKFNSFGARSKQMLQLSWSDGFWHSAFHNNSLLCCPGSFEAATNSCSYGGLNACLQYRILRLKNGKSIFTKKRDDLALNVILATFWRWLHVHSHFPLSISFSETTLCPFLFSMDLTSISSMIQSPASHTCLMYWKNMNPRVPFLYLARNHNYVLGPDFVKNPAAVLRLHWPQHPCK